MFGRVIRGFEIVERIVQVPTDEKDRPRAPVVISNCGELMLRAPAQPKKLERMSRFVVPLYEWWILTASPPQPNPRPKARESLTRTRHTNIARSGAIVH